MNFEQFHQQSQPYIQGLQILLMSGVTVTSASQILESFWNIWSQVSDFPARGPGKCTLFFLQISAEGEFFISYKEGCDEQALKWRVTLFI